MSIDQLSTEDVQRSSREARLVGYDEYIDAQIKHTRRMVKAVDLATTLAVLATGTLAYLLIAAAAEQWLVPGGFDMLQRVLLLTVLVLLAGQYAWRRLWPLVVRTINPVYAAQTIEQSAPSLKNSLLNLLLFRQQRTEITDAVYETLEEQAALRLTRVPVEAAVDRTHLIRFGYALVTVVSLCALYKMFSPKDPLIAVERVLMPWADIVPASRVAITDVRPGTTTLARGEVLDVSADVQGVGADDPVVARYTTADGQAVEKAVSMKASESGLHFTAQLPAATEPGRPAGVSQNLRYQIEAGDARSHVYSVTVIAAPTITIERIDYEYPRYTRLADHKVDNLGDIRAIEGTRVTIHARANSQIDEAAIDFEADGRRDVRMIVNGSEAQASFVLGLRDDHQTPKHKSYALRFTDTDGRANRDPVKYPIDVLPDIAPEAAILSPAEKTRDVRLDETVTISVEARDPDFALSEVRLKGEVDGQRVLDEPLLSKEYTGRFNGRLRFTPSEHSLKSGDLMRYWVAARDNRTPQPNETASESQTLRIGSPEPNQPPPDRVAQRERRPGQPGDAQKSGHERGPDNGQDRQQPDGGNNSSADGQQPNSGAQPAASSERQKNDSANHGGRSPQDQPKDSQRDENQDGNKGQGNQGQDGEQQNGTGGSDNSSQHDQSQKQSGQSSGHRSGEKQSQSGQSQSGGASDGSEDRSGGQQQREGAGDKSGGTKKGQGDAKSGANEKSGRDQMKPSDSQSPVSSEGDNDGEAFDRIQKYLERNGELHDQNKGEKKSPGDGESAKDGGNRGQGQSANDQSQGTKSSSNDGANGARKPTADGQKLPSESGDKNAAKQAQANEQQESKTDRDQQQTGNAKDQKNESAASKDARKQDKDPGQEKRPGTEKPSDSNSAGKGENSQTPNGQPAQSSGETGAGEQSKQNPAPPDTGQPLKPTDKWQQSPSPPDDKKSGEGQEPPSGGQSKRQSDSQGDQGGDHAGGGTQGGGQQAPHSGTGGDGQNQSADEGNGESSEHGKGDTSPTAGHDAQAKDRTGQSSQNQPGNGSKERDGQGSQPGGKPNEVNPSGANQPQGNQSSQKQTDQGQSGKPPGDKNTGENHSGNSNQSDGKPSDANPPSGNQSGNPSNQENKDGNSPQNQHADKGNKSQSSPTEPKGQTGGQQPQDNSKSAGGTQSDAQQKPGSQQSQSGANSGQSSNNGEPGAPQGAGGPNKTDAKAPDADAANLDYANKQTDLVLETLSELMKRKQVDKRLLDELGWSEQDLQKFLARWQQLKEAARGDTPAADAAQKELNDALRSLGLHRGSLQQSKVTADGMRDLKEGYRGPVPLEYQERLRAYNQGVSRARQDSE
jgi:hypothetical protein